MLAGKHLLDLKLVKARLFKICFNISQIFGLSALSHTTYLKLHLTGFILVLNSTSVLSLCTVVSDNRIAQMQTLAGDRKPEPLSESLAKLQLL